MQLKTNDSKNVVQQVAQYCETVFNSPEFYSLFTGDFAEDEKIYELVGGAVMHYINLSKDFDVNKIYKIFAEIKRSKVLERLGRHILRGDEMNLFNQFFAPEILKKIKSQNGNTVDALVDFFVDIPRQHLLSNSFNGYHVARVKAEGLDCTHADPFEKEYETLNLLGSRKYSANGIYFTDLSRTTMHFCQASPERLYVALYNPRKLERNKNENLASFMWRKFDVIIEGMLHDATNREMLKKNKNELLGAMGNLVDAYSNERAGIAFITFQDFCQLSNEELPNFNTPEMREDLRNDINKELERKTSDETEDEIFHRCITRMLLSTEFCRGGIGKCLYQGKVGLDKIAVAQVPQCGLISLHKQQYIQKNQDDNERGLL